MDGITWADLQNAKTVGEMLDALPNVEKAKSVVAGELRELKFSWNPRLRTTGGRCFSRADSPTRIDMNPGLFRDGFDAVREVFLHELAHAVSICRHGKDGGGHGWLWKAVARELGGVSERCHKFAMGGNTRNTRSPLKVVAVCTGCGHELQRRKCLPGNKRYTHRRCGGHFRAV